MHVATRFSSSFERVVAIHCLAELQLVGAGFEQSFDCLIVQNRQAVQSMRSSMDWRTTWSTVCSSAPH